MTANGPIVVADNEYVEPLIPLAAAQDVSAKDVTDGSTASRLKAGLARLEAESSREFMIPGWHDELKILARWIPESERGNADTAAKIITLATEACLLLEDDGTWKELPNGWRGVADEMGLTDASTSDVMTRVFGNGTRMEHFAMRLLAWVAGTTSPMEQLLGE